MKKTGYIFILLMMLTTATVFAQPQRFERIHAIKVAFITDKINLSSSQAERFWPVYNEYEQEIRAARHTAKQYEDDIEFQEAILNIRKHYKNEFLEIISQDQLAKLYAAERDFKRMLIQQLGGRPGGRQRMR